MLPVLLALLAAPVEGRPLFYWGARPPVVVVDDAPAQGPRVVEVHAARDKGDLVVRFTFDQAVRPTLSRMKAVLYMDVDDDPKTGLDQGAADFRTGCERRLEMGAIAMGADEEEKRAASTLVAATLHSLTREGRRRTLWRADDEAAPERLSVHGEWIEVRVPAAPLGLGSSVRFVLAAGDALTAGRLDGPRGAEPGASVDLKVGERVRVAGGTLEIGFEAVLDDSRCPKGQVCVWAGDATVRLALARDGSTKTVDVALSGKTATSLGDGDLAVRLVRLSPVPLAAAKIAPGDYRATLELRRGTDLPADVQ